MIINNFLQYDSVSISEDCLRMIILDQTYLPNDEVFIELKTSEDIYDAIYKLKVRGAPAIGVAAALGIAVCMNNYTGDSIELFEKELLRVSDMLISSRPTAVNLPWAVNRMKNKFYECVHCGYTDLKGVKRVMTDEAKKLKEEDIEMCMKISENGLSLLQKGMGILTHCNAGHLAVSRLGTALGPIHLGQQRGYDFKVYADETRPLLQGARLTSFELLKNGVDTTLICDNMASIVMSQGKIDAVLVGCDRIAANGDVANKIGTSGIAILAKYYKIPFYSLGPSSTIDLKCLTGSDITIEERPSYEMTDMWFDKPKAPIGVKVYNPSFDVTPASLITAIVTEKGVFDPLKIIENA